MYYFYRKSNRGHEICPLYRGCLPFGESVRGFTVILLSDSQLLEAPGDDIRVSTASEHKPNAL